MRTALFKMVLLILAALLLPAAPVWAKSKGYCYIVGYSYVKKAAYFSPIIVQKVTSKSYSDEEYVTDVELIQQLETQFYNHLSRTVRLDADRYTISARGAYKSDAIAGKKMQEEKDQYEAKGYTVKDVTDFHFVE